MASNVEQKSRPAVIYSASSTTGLRICQRPDNGGTSGRKTQVLTNFYPIQIDFSKTFYQYSVEIECVFAKANGQFGKFTVPKESRDFYLKKVLEGSLPRDSFVFNGDAILFSSQPINENRDIQFKKEMPSDKCPGEKDTYIVNIKFACPVNYHNLEVYLSNGLDLPQAEVNLIDLVYRQNRLNSHHYISRCLFDLSQQGQKIDLGKGLFLNTGHYQSLRPTQGGWRFNVDLKSSVFYHEGNLGLFLVEFFGLNPDDNLDANMFQKIAQGTKGLFITVPHLKNNRKFRIQGYSKPADQEMFLMNEGQPNERSVSVADYFKENHFKLVYPHLPCVITAKTPRLIVYPIEACEIPNGERFMKQLPPKLQAIMIKEAAFRPMDHKKRIDEMATAKHSDTQLLQNFGIREVERKQMVTCPARILDPINILYKDGQLIRTRDGAWRMQNRMQYQQPAELNTWLIIWQTKDQRKNEEYNDFVRQKLRYGLVATMKRLGVNVRQDPNMQNLARFSVEEIFNLIRDKMPKKPQLVVFIIDDAPGVYDKIKSTAELKFGLVTQCMKFEKLVSQMDFNVAPNQIEADRKLNSYLENVVNKINAKIGGTNSTVTFKNVKGRQTEGEPVMFMGADVATIASLGKSFAAVVGSYDLDFCKYSVRVSEQMNPNAKKNSQEIILNMEEMAESLIRKFEQRNGRFPTRIIFYRDGVDHGQFQDVLDQEISALKRACARLNLTPKITMVLVVKRHHAKFYSLNQADTIKSGNLMPGTIIDSEITTSKSFDWYMITQQAALGTAKPTYYRVLYDENNFSSDDIQLMTYNLCHLYASCTKSVSLPSPVYYAHLAAYRGINYNDYIALPEMMDEMNLADMEAVKTRLIEIKSDLEEKMFFI